jgi:hypothetical protein
MVEYAPKAITNLFNKIDAKIPAALMGGIIGDSAHTYGYHRGRNYVSSSDYSCQLAADKQGDGEAACGLDISWSAASSQYTVSQRLLNAKNDSRMYACREFYGSTDGKYVCGWDYAGGYAVTSDSSHLWHVHLSILRQYANNDAALDGIAQVITGSTDTGDDTLKLDADDQKWISDTINKNVDWQLRNYFANGEGRPAGGRIYQAVNEAQGDITDDALFVRFTDSTLSKCVFLVTGGHLLLMTGDYGTTGLDMGWLKPRVLSVDSRSSLFKLPIVEGTEDPRVK